MERKNRTMPTQQGEMRRNAKGVIVCERCGGKVTRGWVYLCGSVTLATCSQPQCWPKDKSWWHAINFV